MSTNRITGKTWKILGLGFLILLLNLSILLPFQSGLLPAYDDGLAFAQTGPGDDTPTPIPTAAEPIIIVVPIDGGSGGTGGSGGSGGSGSSGSPGGGGRGEAGRPDNDDDDEGDEEETPTPTPTFTPLPTVTPTPGTPEIIIVITPLATPTGEEPESEPTATPTEAAEEEEAEATTEPSPAPQLITGAPPPGIEPLVGNGAIYRVPGNPNETPARLPVSLTSGPATLTVPTLPGLDKIVRIDEDPSLVINLPAPLPPGIRPLALFNLDLYLNTDGAIGEINSHSPELTFSSQQPSIADNEQGVLLRYSERNQQYEYPRQEYDPTSKTVTAFLSETSIFVLGAQSDQAAAPAPIAPTATAPGEPLPQPGQMEPAPDVPAEGPLQGGSLYLLWIFLAFLVIFIGLLATFLLLGGGRAIANLFNPAPPDAVESGHSPSGLVLAFSRQAVETTAPMQVNLASLPTERPRWAAIPQTTPATQLSLASLGLRSVISSVKPNLPLIRQALEIPTDVRLIGWDEISFRLSKLTYAVVAGYLDISNRENMFARLHESKPGDLIEIIGQTKTLYQYVVEEVETYQTDLNAQVTISPTRPGLQLLVIGWSEAYDLDEQEYRDYVIIRAYMSNGAAQEDEPTSQAEAISMQPT